MLLFDLIEILPTEIIHSSVLNWLELGDLVRLERACSKHQLNLLIRNCLPNCSPVYIENSDDNYKVVDWLETTRCSVHSLRLYLPGQNSILDRNLVVHNYHLILTNTINNNDIQILQERVLNLKIAMLTVGVQDIQTLVKLAQCFPNVRELIILKFNGNDWLTNNILSYWNLLELTINNITTERMNKISLIYLHNLTYL